MTEAKCWAIARDKKFFDIHDFLDWAEAELLTKAQKAELNCWLVEDP